jgi:heterodisulfide reductase subunit A
MDKCIACGLCAEKCPKKVPDAYDGNLSKRKAVYVQYAQAVPLKYAIDADQCIYFKKGKCKACEKFCPAGAINFEDQPRELTITAGAVLIAPGCGVYDPGLYDTYGYKKSPNIVTSLEFERILAATGPFGGHLVRPSDHKEPEKIAWIQCVGSRDMHPGSQSYCSGVCCTYAIKEAIIAKEHQKGKLDTAIFYIDIRTHGKDFERYYNRAQEAGVRFLKSRITSILPSDTGNFRISYTDKASMRVEEEFDMVVLSVGFAVSHNALDLAQKLGVEMDHYHHALTSSFNPVRTTKTGIFVCGTFESPKDIPQSVVESSAAAAEIEGLLSESRGSMTRTKKTPEELDVKKEPPRIGVFVCNCGTNIGGFVDVPDVVEYAKTLPSVVFAEDNLFSCSQDTQEQITQVIKEQNLNRVVVAACTPRTHEPLFQETVLNAGINKYLFEMANIRNQCSWVHSGERAAATEKAKDLVRMAVAKVGLLQPLSDPEIEMNPSALVIGGGLAGITTANNLAQQGYVTYLIEKSDVLGGQALNLYETWQGEDVQKKLAGLIKEAEADKNIHILTNTQIKEVSGFVGNFRTRVETAGTDQVIEHGVAIIATGAQEFKPDQYLYGEDSRVLTGLELDRKFIEDNLSLNEIHTAAFIQCVGSRIKERPYCSKVCCTHSVKNALKLKQLKPEMDVFIIYRDMRTYGLREDLYREARAKGIAFIHYDLEKELTVSKNQNGLNVRCTSYVLQREVEIRPDLLVLATPIVPPRENSIASLFKVPLNDDGFFVEAHVKLQPIDFATKGVFVCGLAHSPKPVDEAIAQGLGAASRAVTLLSQKKVLGNAIISSINAQFCRGCQKCMSVCPYQAINFLKDRGICEVNPAICTGCGSCAVACPTGAADVFHFDDQKVLTMVKAAFN